MPQVLTLEITDSTQFATLFVDGAPRATFQRRRVYDRVSPAWRVFATDGREVGFFAHSLPAVTMARRALRMLEAHA